MVGPGLIAANAGNDAGGITTWSVIGSRYGYSMLWLLVVITPILAIVQEMNARVGVVTGRGLAGLIRENFSLKITALAILATVIANFGTTVAEFSGVAAASSLFHVPSYVAVPAVAVGVWLLVTRGSYRKVERVLLVLGFVLAHLRRLRHPGRPGLERRLSTARRTRTIEWNSLWIFTAIAAVGTTLTPWGQFFIQAAVVDKKVPWQAVRVHQVRDLRRLRVHDDASTSSSSSPAPPPCTRTASSCSSARGGRHGPGAVPRRGRAVPLRHRPAERLDPRRRRAAAGHRLRGLRGLRLRERPRQLVPRGARVQRPHHVPDVRAGRRRHHPRAAARERHPRRAVAQRHPAAGDPHVHAAS